MSTNDSPKTISSWQSNALARFRRFSACTARRTGGSKRDGQMGRFVRVRLLLGHLNASIPSQAVPLMWLSPTSLGRYYAGSRHRLETCTMPRGFKAQTTSSNITYYGQRPFFNGCHIPWAIPRGPRTNFRRRREGWLGGVKSSSRRTRGLEEFPSYHHRGCTKGM